MLNGSFKTFNPVEEDGRQVFQSRALPYGFHSGDDPFNRLKCPVLYLVPKYIKRSKFARAQV
jgi:hypothetical protein